MLPEVLGLTLPMLSGTTRLILVDKANHVFLSYHWLQKSKVRGEDIRMYVPGPCRYANMLLCLKARLSCLE